MNALSPDIVSIIDAALLHCEPDEDTLAVLDAIADEVAAGDLTAEQALTLSTLLGRAHGESLARALGAPRARP